MAVIWINTSSFYSYATESSTHSRCFHLVQKAAQGKAHGICQHCAEVFADFSIPSPACPAVPSYVPVERWRKVGSPRHGKLHKVLIFLNGRNEITVNQNASMLTFLNFKTFFFLIKAMSSFQTERSTPTMSEQDRGTQKCFSLPFFP